MAKVNISLDHLVAIRTLRIKELTDKIRKAEYNLDRSEQANRRLTESVKTLRASLGTLYWATGGFTRIESAERTNAARRYVRGVRPSARAVLEATGGIPKDSRNERDAG